MLTRLACSTAPGARPFSAKATACRVLGPTSTPLLQARHRQQIRTFRFGMWSSYLDPEFQRELRHRHQTLKRKYGEALNRRLSWDQHPLDDNPKVVIKHMFRRYWHPSRARYTSRFVNQDELNDRHQHVRGASDDKDAHMKTPWGPSLWGNFHTWISHLDEATNQWTKSTSSNTTRAESNRHSRNKSARVDPEPNKKKERNVEASSVEDYVIDPITNRKVPRKDYGVSDNINPSPADSFRSYRAQFTASAPRGGGRSIPIHCGPPPAELKEYGQVHIDQAPSDDRTPSQFSRDGGKTPQHAISQSEEYSLNHLPPEESTEQNDDLHRYQAYRHDELPEQTRAPEPTKKYEDLDKYKTYGPKEAESTSTDIPQHSDELHKYKPYMYNENVKIENQTPQYDDLGQYGPYKYREDVKTDESCPKYDDLDKYKHYVDDNVKPMDDSAPKYEDLNKYNTTDLGDSFTEEQPFEQYGDLDKYRAFKYQEHDDKTALERDTVAESLKEYEAKEQGLNSSEDTRPSIADRLRKLNLSDAEFSQNSGSITTSSHLQKNNQPADTRAKSRESLEQYMTSHVAASDAADRDASSSIKESRARAAEGEENQEDQHKLTGNYVRDFPEDFSGPWNFRASGSSLEPGVDAESKKLNEKMTHIQAIEKQYSDQLPQSMDFATLETSSDKQQTKSKLESALDRQEKIFIKGTLNHPSRTRAEVDPYSKEPQGLEISYAKECNEQQTSPGFNKMYGGELKGVIQESPATKEDTSQTVPQFESFYERDPEIDGRPPAPSSKSDPETEPMVYKILAYDPTMEKVEITETISTVPDHATPLTPAEALLHLSKPAKFLPHFAPLQAEGFEIVSGDGDMLIFRQIRPGKITNKETAALVNPIDMMGKPTALPNAAAFASPTGFVNYDMPQVEEPQAPPFRSNIDVRREEPVFSGPKSPNYEGARGRKKSLGRRVLIGGAWVGGISYALGVVSEYFITGGADGRGPTGF
ncbi:hypothetical protein AAE478_001976 [Parahypoxylon ruwenzoriense]